MLIGIDASRAAIAQATGTEFYSQQLIRALIDLAPDHRFRLYFNRALSDARLAASHVEARVIPFPRLWTHVRLSVEVTRRPPDVLFVPAHVLPLLRPPRSVVTIHDLGYLHFPDAHPTLQRLYLDISTRWNARVAARVIADSQATRDDLIKHYHTPAEKIVVAYPGLGPQLRPVNDVSQRQTIAMRYALPSKYVLTLGTLQPRKNLARLIDAFAQSALRARDVVLAIAGRKGWLYDDLFRQVEQAGLSQHVLFLGYVRDEDKAALLSGARMFVLPSLYEGFGFPVIEAMACGAPVICSNNSSLPEVAGDAARLVDPLDVQALAAALDELDGDTRLRETLIVRGHLQARRFKWEACARTVLDVLENV